MEKMEDILSDQEPEAKEEVEAPVEEKAAETPEKPTDVQEAKRQHRSKEMEAQGRDPSTGQFLPKETEETKTEVKAEPEAKVEQKVEAPKQEFTEKERAFLKAAQEERNKRQELERRLAELEKKAPEKDAKTFWDDPEGHFKQFEQKLDQRDLKIRLQTTETVARSRYKDFDEVVPVFAEILEKTPGLHAQWLNSPDPAEFAYRTGKHHKELRDAGSIDQLREKIQKEERTKLEAEFKKKAEDLEKQRAALPPSLSEVRGAVKQNQPVFSGPTPFADILKG